MGLNYIDDQDIDAELRLLDEAAIKLTPLIKFRDEVLAHFEQRDTDSGDRLPWPKTHESIRLRPAELSIWSGISGHGKTGFLNQIMGSIIGQGKVVVVASLEMRPQVTVLNMVRQQAGCKSSKKFVDDWITSYGSNFWLYNQTNQVPSDRILAMARYAARVLKADHIVIDSLMKCGLDEDDYNGQKKLVDKLAWVAKEFDTHIHLVAHSRKLENEYKEPSKFDVAGGASITNLADNVFVVFRNKRREEALRNKSKGLKFDPHDLQLPSTFLTVCKNRHGGQESKFGFYFDQASTSFLEYVQ